VSFVPESLLAPIVAVRPYHPSASSRLGAEELLKAIKEC
jgi:hypothetical protein